jgi:predicted acyltransferase
VIAAPFSAPRLLSLDVLRGATVALMILVNNPGSWAHLYPPLAHAQWHGLTPTDLVFPFFLFAVGNALALVMPALLAGAPGLFWRRVAQRTLLIFLIGLALNASPFVRWDAAGDLVWRSWDTLRLMGVLQRIALAFGAAALIVWVLSRRTADAGPRVLWACAALLLGYWVAMLALGDRGDPYSLEGFFGTAIDRALLGAAHLYRGEGVPFDPEGLASTVPAVAQVLLGWWVGDAVRTGLATAPAGAAGPGARDALVARLAAQATLLLALGWLWSLVLPLNKKIWTPSYVLLSTGLAMLALALLLHLLEQRPASGAGARRPLLRTTLAALGQGAARLAAAFGRNALAVFVLSGLVPRVLALWRWPDGSAADGTPAWITPLPWLYRSFFADLAPDPRLGSLAFALANLALYAALAWWLDRRRIYIRV